jgi:hypothetical protein
LNNLFCNVIACHIHLSANLLEQSEEFLCFIGVWPPGSSNASSSCRSGYRAAGSSRRGYGARGSTAHGCTLAPSEKTACCYRPDGRLPCRRKASRHWTERAKADRSEHWHRERSANAKR